LIKNQIIRIIPLSREKERKRDYNVEKNMNLKIEKRRENV